MTTTNPASAFRNAYMLELAKQRTAKPDVYAWPIEELPTVADKMLAALARGGANIDSPAIRAACKICRFKPGIERIRQFLACETWEDAMRKGLVQ